MHPSSFTSRALLLMIFVSALTADFAFAARIERVKGKQVLIDGEGEELAVGDKFFAISDGKKRGLIRIDQAKSGKAIGTVTKGRADENSTLESTKKSAQAETDVAPTEKKKRKRSGSYHGGEPALFVGGLVGYAMDSQTVKDSAGASIAMTGSGLSFKGFGDMPISGRLGIIGRVGYEQLSLKGSVSGVTYTTEINYGTADLLLRYNILESQFTAYIAGGLGLHFPISKESNILDKDRIASTTVFFGTLGGNYFLSETSYLTVVGEYGMFPPSNDVTTTLIAVRAGMAWKF